MSETHVNTQENIILIDWFSFTSKIDCLDTIKRLLGLDDPSIIFQELGGMHGYKDRLYFEGISIHYNGSDKMNLKDTVWVEMSGQGCRAFEQYSSHKDWRFILSLLLADLDSYNITRCDIAYDDWSGLLDISLLKREAEKHNIVTKFRDYGVDMSFVNNDITLYFGSKKSDVLFRCYNKAAERGKEDEIRHWIRFEMQLRDAYALKFLQEFYKSDDLGHTFSGVLKHYLRFVKPSRSDSNKARWCTRPWWQRFVENAESISLYTQKGTDYNEYKLHEFVVNNVGNAVDTFITIFGEQKLVADLKQRRTRLSAKYKQLIDSHKLRQAQDNAADILKCLGEYNDL